MQIEKQCCTLDQAKRIKDLGVEQNSLYYFYEANINGISSTPIVNRYSWNYGMLENNAAIHNSLNKYVTNQCYSAFTVAELGVMLPSFPEWNWETYYHSTDEVWNCQFGGKGIGGTKTEAQGRALILIYLLENNLTTPAEVNQRLNS